VVIAADAYENLVMRAQDRDDTELAKLRAEFEALLRIDANGAFAQAGRSVLGGVGRSAEPRPPRAGSEKNVASRFGRIVVVAGTNGAGKSSIANGFMPEPRSHYFNPDAFASALTVAGKPPTEANALVWRMGYDRLRAAIDRGDRFTFETTLGGESIIAELHRALTLRREVHVCTSGCHPSSSTSPA
jgi:hypothetical protein